MTGGAFQVASVLAAAGLPATHVEKSSTGQETLAISLFCFSLRRRLEEPCQTRPRTSMQLQETASTPPDTVQYGNVGEMLAMSGTLVA